MISRLPAFPARQNESLKTPAFLAEHGFFMRHANDADLPRLRQLYAGTRAEEMAYVPWPDDIKQNFLDQQFNLQHLHYLNHYAEADFQVMEHDGILQGRYYLLKTAPSHLVVDICMMPEYRGRGIGAALIEDSLREAAELGRDMNLQVVRSNTNAQRLYRKLGFVICNQTDTHYEMYWQNKPKR